MNRLLLGGLLPLTVAACSVEPTSANDEVAASNLVAIVPEAGASTGNATPFPTTDADSPSNQGSAPREAESDDPLYIAPARLTSSEQALADRARWENSQCRGDPGNQAATLAACERRQKLMNQLEKTGVCWGGATIEAKMHWIRCAEDPSFKPGQFEQPYISEAGRGALKEQAGQNFAGDTFTCRFPKAGRVIIDTREPGSSITYRGKTYPASGGTYFYAANEDPKLTVLFGPRMSWWEFGTQGERATACTRRSNRG